jgi:D-alanine-D-alanine ligase
MNFKVGLTYNLKQSISSTDEDFDDYAEFDDEETVNAIAAALTKGGCNVTKIEANAKAYTKLMKLKPTIVFNIAEGLHGESRRSHIPAMMEMLEIPYSGSGPLTLAITLNKGLTHQVLSIAGIPSPSFQVFTNSHESISKQLEFPLVVKPLAEGSSKGVTQNALVRDEESLRKQVSWVTSRYRQPAIVEQFLSGREFTVSLIGNTAPTVLPVVEILLENLPGGSSTLYSYEAKWIWDTPEKPLNMFRCPANIPHKLEEKITHIAKKTFATLHCRDVCRIDIRLDDDQIPHVLEVNALPGMISDPKAHSCLPVAASTVGYTYDQLICTILWQALKRYNLQQLFNQQSLITIP